MLGNRIFTKRLILRKIEQDDLRLLTEWSCSASAYGDFLTPENHSYQDIFELWQSNSFWNDHSMTLMIEHKEKCQPIGTIRYWEKQNDRRTALVALKIALPDFRCQGLGTESQLGFINYLFKQGHYQNVEMFTDIDNRPEQRCLEKLGFSFISVQSYDDHDLERQGRLYRLTEQEYEKQLQMLSYT